MYREEEKGGTKKGHRSQGNKVYELSNHLGNVLAAISDVKQGVDSDQDGTIDYYETHTLSTNDYYPFGLSMKERSFVEKEYRYGFNGKENDSDFGNKQVIQDYGFRLYNPSIGKFLSVDPLAPDYPELTPYQFAGNTPIRVIDLDRLEPVDINGEETTNPSKVASYKWRDGEGFKDAEKALRAIGYDAPWEELVKANPELVKHFKGNPLDIDNEEHKFLNTKKGDLINLPAFDEVKAPIFSQQTYFGEFSKTDTKRGSHTLWLGNQIFDIVYDINYSVTVDEESQTLSLHSTSKLIGATIGAHTNKLRARAEVEWVVDGEVLKTFPLGAVEKDGDKIWLPFSDLSLVLKNVKPNPNQSFSLVFKVYGSVTKGAGSAIPTKVKIDLLIETILIKKDPND